MISTVFLVCLFILPFLIPWHPPNATMLLPESLAFGFGIVAMFTVKQNNSTPLFTVTLTGLCALVAIQPLILPLFGLHIDPLKSVVGVTYLSFAAIMIYTGAQLKINQIYYLQNALIFGSCLVAFSGIVQNYHINTLLGSIGTEIKHYEYGFAGTVAQRNLFADYVALGLAAIVFQVKSPWNDKQWEYGLRLIVVILLATVLALGDTRSGLIYVLIITLAAVPSRNWFAVYVPITYIAATVIATLMSMPTVAERLINTPVTTDPRFGFIIEALLEFSHSPLIGIGFGNFGTMELFTPFADSNSHNLFAQILAETGLIGLACILFPIWRIITQSNWQWPETISSYLLASLGILLWHSMIEFPFWYAHFLGVGSVLLGLVYSLSACHHEK